jgi:hypothetical protein
MKQINQLIANSGASTITVGGMQDSTFVYIGSFFLMSLILGVILFLSRHFIIDIVSKIGNMFRSMVEKYLFKLPNFERYYNQGFFLLHWTLVWLICRLTVIKPIYETLMVDSKSLVLQIFIQVLSIVLAMVIALIPVTLMTCSEWVNNWISVLHFSYCSDYQFYIRFILRLHVIRCRIYRTQAMKLMVFIPLFMVFMAYLVTNEKILLFLFLSVIYSKLYVENFTLKVMPNATRIADFNTKLPLDYFLANFKYRYWQNKVPLMLGGGTFEADYYFEAITRGQYLALKSLYDDILFMEYVTDPSIPPQERLKIYTKVMKPLEGKTDGVILESIKADLKIAESKARVKKERPSRNTQGRSFHTSSANTFPIEDGGLGENPNSRISEEVRLTLGNDLNPGIRDLLERIPLRTYNFGEFVGVNPETPTTNPEGRLLNAEEVLEVMLNNPEVRALEVEELLQRLLAGEGNSSSGSVNSQVGSGSLSNNEILTSLLNDREDRRVLALEDQRSRQASDQLMRNIAVEDAQNAAAYAAEQRAIDLEAQRHRLAHEIETNRQALQETSNQTSFDAARGGQRLLMGRHELTGRRLALLGLTGSMVMYGCNSIHDSFDGGALGAFWDRINNPLPENPGGESKMDN